MLVILCESFNMVRETDRSMVAVPDMAGWQQMINEGKYTMAKKEIRTFLEDFGPKGYVG